MRADLTSVGTTRDDRCLDLLRTRGRAALPEALALLGRPTADIVAGEDFLTRRDVVRIAGNSGLGSAVAGTDRGIYVDMWSSVISSVLTEPTRDRLFYHLLGLG